jgi:hypothetical protein
VLVLYDELQTYVKAKGYWCSIFIKFQNIQNWYYLMSYDDLLFK